MSNFEGEVDKVGEGAGSMTRPKVWCLVMEMPIEGGRSEDQFTPAKTVVLDHMVVGLSQLVNSDDDSGKMGKNKTTHDRTLLLVALAVWPCSQKMMRPSSTTRK